MIYACLAVAFLPLARGFGSTPGFGTEAAGGTGGFRPPIEQFPENVCTNLAEYKVITEDTEWCSSKKTEDDCMPPGLGATLKMAYGHMTSQGKKIAYDVCAWDDSKGKCRLARMSYFCSVECSGTPDYYDEAQGRSLEGSERKMARSSEEVTIEVVPRKRLVQGYGEFDWVKIDTKQVVLKHSGRRLETSEPEERRRLQTTNPCNPVSLPGGGSCCVTEPGGAAVGDGFFEGTDLHAPRSNAIVPVGPQGPNSQSINKQSCQVVGDECECTMEEPDIIAYDACQASKPIYWGANGARL